MIIFQSFCVVSKVAEGLNLAGAAKLAVAETYDSEGRFMQAANGSYGLPQPISINGNYVSTVAITDQSGTITITYKNSGLGGNPTADGQTMVPHHRANDIASDNRLLPQHEWSSTHSFALGCADPVVDALLVHRPYPVSLARERGWPATQTVMVEVSK